MYRFAVVVCICFGQLFIEYILEYKKDEYEDGIKRHLVVFCIFYCIPLILILFQYLTICFYFIPNFLMLAKRCKQSL